MLVGFNPRPSVSGETPHPTWQRPTPRAHSVWVASASHCFIPTARNQLSTHRRRHSATSSQVEQSSTAPPETLIPEATRKATAVVQFGDVSLYILGISHVSKESCNHIRDLIDAVKPDTVLVELCKDRTGLFVDDSIAKAPPNRWYTRRLRLRGYVQHDGWPSQYDLLRSLKSFGNSPVTALEIEDDAVRLLESGIFGAVTLVAKPPGPREAPAFVKRTGSNGLETVAPLSEIEFVVTERVIPEIAAFEIIDDTELLEELPVSTLEEVRAAAKLKSVPALYALLKARKMLLDALQPSSGNPANVSIDFSGVESGHVVARVSLHTTESMYRTGLESSAAGGRGIGIQEYERRSPLQSFAPFKGRDRVLESLASKTSDGKQTAPATDSAAVEIEPWSEAQIQMESTGSRSQESNDLADAFAEQLTQQYAKYQAAAGHVVGIGPGAAWQVAMQAAARCGARRILLGDRPAGVTSRRLAQGIWNSSFLSLLGALSASIAGAVLTGSTRMGESAPFSLAAPVVVALLPAMAALWPILAPLIEVSNLSRLSAPEIEAAVALSEPIQSNIQTPFYLWGEDALLKWPGALNPIIHERDQYMARAMIGATIEGSAGTVAGVPAYVCSGDGVYRYAMPHGGNPTVCPAGEGDGRYRPWAAKKVIAVVGTAHVRGIVADLERLSPKYDVEALSLERYV